MDTRTRQIELLRAKIQLRRAQIYQLESDLNRLQYNANSDPTLEELAEKRRIALESHRREWESVNGPIAYHRRRPPSAEDEIDC